MLKLFKHLTYKQVLVLIVSIGFIVFQVWLDLKMPDYLNKVLELSRAEGSQMSEILKNGGFMLLCAFGSLASAIIVGFFSARIATGFGATLRQSVFYKTTDFSMAEINGFSTPSLITRTTNDITQVQTVIAMGMQVLIKAPILAVWAIIKISGKNWQWMASTAAAVGVLIILILIVVLVALPKFKKMQTLLDNLNRETRENLTGLRVVRSFNASDYQEQKFEKANKELNDTSLFTSRIMAIMMPGMNLILSGLTLAIYWVGAYIINAAASPVTATDPEMFKALALERGALLGDMMVFSSYAMQVIFAFIMMTMVFIMLPRAVVAGKRVSEVLDTPLSIASGSRDIHNDSRFGEVEFKNVGFKYPDAEGYVLNDVSFKIKKGETIAFIGSTGSGKSTLINLVPRFYDATEGQILIDGVNIKDMKLEDLRDKIGYVSQKAVLFAGTVRDNIAYSERGTVMDEATVLDAAKIAQADEFIQGLEGGYEAAVSQGGTNLSGGQKQRIAIARAVAKKPEVYIFDDSFSALDYKTDRVLRTALKERLKDAACMIVGQRIGTIRDADRIMVLEEGDVVGLGTHDELMQTCKVYQEIAYSQLSKEELA